MSTFSRFVRAVKRTAKKVVTKTEEVADNAAAAVKIRTLQIDIDEQYEKLGELVYRDLHTEENLEEEKLQVIAAIDALFDKMTALQKERDDTKADEEEVEEAAEETPAEGEEVTEEATEETPAEETPVAETVEAPVEAESADTAEEPKAE